MEELKIVMLLLANKSNKYMSSCHQCSHKCCAQAERREGRVCGPGEPLTIPKAKGKQPFTLSRDVSLSAYCLGQLAIAAYASQLLLRLPAVLETLGR